MARTAKENIREKILDAAERRLWRYGIKKTTIDEIAADAGVGKGTVYLYFESKEDISLAILSGYKIGVLRDQASVVENPDLDTVQKISKFLILPILCSRDRCQQCPEALELMIDLKPHLAEHMRPYRDKEIELLAKILTEGNNRGILDVADPIAAATSLKTMTWGLYPHFPFVAYDEPIEQMVNSIVCLVVRGLKSNVRVGEATGAAVK